MAVKLSVVGRGGGGVDEMRGSLDDNSIAFGLVRFTFGSGTFKRDKFIFVHFNAEKCAAMKRARTNAQKGAIHGSLGGTNADLEITATDQCTVTNFFEKLNHVFVSDSGDFSLGDMKADYERMCAAAVAQAAEADAGEAGPPPKRPTAADLNLPVEKVLQAIREPTGPFNWALFHPGVPLKLVNAGSLSLPEMQEYIPEDNVLYGILRMGFGLGQFRRTKWVFIHWVGAKTPPVKRGKASAASGEMNQALKPHNVGVELASPDDLELQAFVERVKRSFVVDEKGGGKAKQEEGFGLDDFLAALKEEQAANAEFFGDTKGAPATQEKPLYEFEETLRLLRKDGSGVNWALFAP
eukprot:TRINITY_DN33291_c0_g1_i1.p1 TRINITY_DN33291_c0_g1~~TRINITY_DN33291_c0_g1_i1.p1  ORF type:complete len:364 (+),score=77.61 TRINITY_DN33291_c0_g1_i1:38-1093(+)